MCFCFVLFFLLLLLDRQTLRNRITPLPCMKLVIPKYTWADRQTQIHAHTHARTHTRTQTTTSHPIRRLVMSISNKLMNRGRIKITAEDLTTNFNNQRKKERKREREKKREKENKKKERKKEKKGEKERRRKEREKKRERKRKKGERETETRKEERSHMLTVQNFNSERNSILQLRFNGWSCFKATTDKTTDHRC